MHPAEKATVKSPQFVPFHHTSHHNLHHKKDRPNTPALAKKNTPETLAIVLHSIYFSRFPPKNRMSSPKTT
jgi:hypothetical protein